MKNLTIQSFSRDRVSKLYCTMENAEAEKLLEKLAGKYILNRLPTGKYLFQVAEHETSLMIEVREAGIASTVEQVMGAIGQLLTDPELAEYEWTVERRVGCQTS